MLLNKEMKMYLIDYLINRLYNTSLLPVKKVKDIIKESKKDVKKD